MEEIPSPGVPNYVSELVSYLSRRAELQGWVPDGTLLALWLMTLMNQGWGGGGGGIILDVDVSSSRRPGGAIGRATRQAVTVSCFAVASADDNTVMRERVRLPDETPTLEHTQHGVLCLADWCSGVRRHGARARLLPRCDQVTPRGGGERRPAHLGPRRGL